MEVWWVHPIITNGTAHGKFDTRVHLMKFLEKPNLRLVSLSTCVMFSAVFLKNACE